MAIVTYKLEIIKSATIQVRAYGDRFVNGFTVIEHLPYPCSAKSHELLRDIGVKAAKRMKTTFIDMTI